MHWDWLTDPRTWGHVVDDVEERLRDREAWRRLRREKVAVPDVRGHLYRKAWETLLLEGFRVKVHALEPMPAPEEGLVVAQDPPPGTVVRQKTRVRLSVLHPPAT